MGNARGPNDPDPACRPQQKGPENVTVISHKFLVPYRGMGPSCMDGPAGDTTGV